MSADLSREEHDALVLHLAQLGMDANALLRAGTDVDAVRARLLEQIRPYRLADALMVLVAALPTDRPVTDLLAWTVGDLKPGQRPAWVWQSSHDAYEEMVAAVTPDEIPPEVRTGEVRYQAAIERQRKPDRAA